MNGNVKTSAGGDKAARSSAAKSLDRDRYLIGWNREPALGDMEDAFGGAPVAARVVQNALRHAVRTQERRREAGRVRRQRHHPSQPWAVEHHRTRGQPRDIRYAIKILVEKGLYAGVAGTQMVAQEPILGLVTAQQRLGDFEESGLRRAVARRLAERRQLEVQVPD